MIERGSLNKCRLIRRLWTENSFVSLHISMKEKINHMSKFKYVDYGDEKFVYNTETGQVVSHWIHLDEPRKKQSILTRVLSKCGRIFTA